MRSIAGWDKSAKPGCALACAAGLLALTISAPAWATSYYCDLSQGTVLGSYRPNDGGTDLDIKVGLPADEARFWFDNVEGHYQAYRNGQALPVEYGRLPIPLEGALAEAAAITANDDREAVATQRLAVMILAGFAQCIEAPMGQLPPNTPELSDNG